MIDYPAILNQAWQQHLAPREPGAPTVISTFAGCGGSSLGYSMAGFQELLAVEWDDNAAQTFALNFPDVPLYHGDIAALSVEDCLERAGIKVGELDVFDGSPPCFPAGQHVLTSCGKIPIEFCTAGMSVLTHTGKFERVSHVFERQYAGKLVTLELKYGRKPVVSTADHQVFARRRIEKIRGNATRKNSTRYKAYTEPEWIAAKDLMVGDVTLEPHASGEPALELPPVRMKHRINIEGQSGADSNEMRVLERECQVNWQAVEMAWILGFFLAEGHTRGHQPSADNDGPCRREVIFSIADRETVDLVERLNAVGFHAMAQRHSQGSSRVWISSPDLWVLCQSMGKGAGGKFIPAAFLCMPVEWQSAFLDGYFSGDGCVVSSKRVNSQNRKATTISWDVATGIAKMIAKVYSVVASIGVLYPAGMSKIQGRDVQVQEAYSVGYALLNSSGDVPNRVRPGFVDGHGAWIPNKSVTLSDTDGTPVYNLEVDTDHSYTVEDVAVHNCQGFSTAGKREMSDSRNQLFREYVRLLRGLQPKVFVMENVSGMVKGKMKLIFAEILRELKASGYQVSARLLNAKYFHVPQSRERMIFIGVRNDLGIMPTHPKAQSAPFGPVIEKSSDDLLLTQEQFKKIDRHKRQQREKGNGFGWQEVKATRPSCAILKNMMIGGANTRLVRQGNGWRWLTDNEIRQIGSFPLAFNFTGRESMIERIGNSVPPLFMRAIAGHIRHEILA